MTDAEILEGLKRMNIAAFRTLCLKYFDAVEEYALSFNTDSAKVHEDVNALFLALFPPSPEFEIEPPLLPWLKCRLFHLSAADNK